MRLDKWKARGRAPSTHANEGSAVLLTVAGPLIVALRRILALGLIAVARCLLLVAILVLLLLLILLLVLVVLIRHYQNSFSDWGKRLSNRAARLPARASNSGEKFVIDQ
jgi:predicted PurR-regulated permease PerM